MARRLDRADAIAIASCLALSLAGCNYARPHVSTAWRQQAHSFRQANLGVVDLQLTYTDQSAPEVSNRLSLATAIAPKLAGSASRALSERGFQLSGGTVVVGTTGDATTSAASDSVEYQRAISHIPTILSIPSKDRPLDLLSSPLRVKDAPAQPGAWWDPSRAEGVDSIIVFRTSALVETEGDRKKRMAWNLTGGLALSVVFALGGGADAFIRSPAWIEHRMTIQSARTGEVVWEQAERFPSTEVTNDADLERSVRQIVSWIGPMNITPVTGETRSVHEPPRLARVVHRARHRCVTGGAS